jgi:hypothetical protein
MSRRGRIILGATVVMLAVVLVVADRLAHRFAEQQVAHQLRNQLHSAQDPAVGIRGFPFLTQVAMGDYPEINVQADSVNRDRLRDVGLAADLRHVRLPVSDVASGSVSHVTVDQVSGRVRVPAADIGQLTGVGDLHLDPAAGNAITISGNHDLAGVPIHAAVTALVTTGNDSVRIQPQALDARLSGLPNLPLDVRDPRLLAPFATTLDSRQLPLGFHPTAVAAGHDVLLVDVTAAGVSLGGQ